jgi:hypothetical protein
MIVHGLKNERLNLEDNESLCRSFYENEIKEAIFKWRNIKQQAQMGSRLNFLVFLR